jgi:ribosome maturation factor RimP
MEQRVTNLIESTVTTLGFDIVKVIIHGTSTKVVEILIERIDGEKVQVNDCQIVSRNISAVLDVEDIIPGKYFLEVSSAGVERPLVKITDFEKLLRHFQIKNHPTYHLIKARISKQQGNIQEALKTLQLAMQLPGVKKACKIDLDRLIYFQI